MKIVLIITGLGMGGAERQVCNLADSFADAGHQVLLLSLTGQAINLPCNTDVRVEQLKMIKTPLSFLKTYRYVAKLIRNFCPDVVHSHMIHANLFARLLRLSISIPRLISTAHSTNEGGKLKMLAYSLTDKLADLSTNVSESAVAAFIEKGACRAGRMIAIHNGIDTKHFRFNMTARDTKRSELGITEKTKLLLAVGRLEMEKDYSTLLKAFSLLITQRLNTHLVIIGTGTLDRELHSLAHQLDITNHVHFLGMRNDVEAWMSSADIYVLSSMYEGFGLVVAEAMACERFVVATNCGGVKEVAGEYGSLVAPGNSDALSAAIMSAFRKPIAEISRQGILAREWIKKKYSLSAVVKKWVTIYESGQQNLN
jgi:glycosyltransferase involved in cell wall biosynthesis